MSTAPSPSASDSEPSTLAGLRSREATLLEKLKKTALAPDAKARTEHYLAEVRAAITALSK